MSRYLHLMSPATIELVYNTLISAYGLYLSIRHDQIRPWVSWSNTHFDWHHRRVPGALLARGPATVVAVELGGGVLCVCVLCGGGA
jgi:pheromone a factor receptor